MYKRVFTTVASRDARAKKVPEDEIEADDGNLEPDVSIPREAVERLMRRGETSEIKIADAIIADRNTPPTLS